MIPYIFFIKLMMTKNKRLTSVATFNIKTTYLQSIFVKPDSTPLKQYKPDSLTTEKYDLVAEKIRLQNENKFNQLKILKEVIVRTKERSRKDSLDEEYTTGFFKGGDGYTFVTEEDPFANSALSVLQYLQGKVPGLQVSASGSQASLSWRGGVPTLFLNEMQGDVD